MKLSEMFPRKYASGEALNGKPATLTIVAVRTEKMRPQAGAPEVQKYVVYFEGTTKGVILSRTLAYQIADITSSEETADWIGQKITLYPQPMMVAGKRRIAIRARKPAAGNGTATLSTSLNENDEL